MYQSINLIYSLIFSILFLFGIYQKSQILAKNINIKFLTKYFYKTNSIFFILYLNFIIYLSYVFFLKFNINYGLLKSFTYLTCFIGIFGLINFKKNILHFFKIEITSKNWVFLILIISLFIFSLAPLSDPDSLDYHIGLPLQSLKNGYLFINNFWISSLLSGAFEAFLIIPISQNLFHFSTLIQFVSIICIYSLILNFKKFKIINGDKNICLLFLFSSPVLLFLNYSAKPTLFPIASNFFAFLLVFYVIPDLKKSKEKIIIFSIVCFLTLISTQIKFNFFLTAAILLSFSLLHLFQKKIFYKSLLVLVFFCFIIILPKELYDYFNINSDIFGNFLKPVNPVYISETVNNSLKVGNGLNLLVPLWLIIPPNLSLVTVTIGLGLLAICFVNRFFDFFNSNIFLAIALYFLILFVFGQPHGRYFYEVYIWLIFYTMQHIKNQNYLFSIFKKIFIVQAFFVICSLNFINYFSITSYISRQNFNNYLSNFADGYQAYQWGNSKLKDTDRVIVFDRSLSLANFNALNIDYRIYMSRDNLKAKEYLLDQIKKFKPSYILYGLDFNHKKYDLFINCRGKLIAKLDKGGRVNFRNPIKKSELKYDLLLYEIETNSLDKCN